MTERDKNIAQDYMDGRTVCSLGLEYGLTQGRIWQILAKKGISGSHKRKRLRRLPSQRKPLTKVHEILGRRISEFKMDNRIDTNELTKRLNYSKNKLSLVEKGYKDITLLELMEISRLLKVPVGDILNQCDA